MSDQEVTWNYLSVERVMWLARQIDVEPVVVQPDRLEAACAAPQQSVFGEDAYRDVAEKASALSFGLVKGHPFADGNKRTGAAAALYFLVTNSHQTTLSSDDLYELYMGVADGTVSREQLTDRLRETVTPVESVKGGEAPVGEPARPVAERPMQVRRASSRSAVPGMKQPEAVVPIDLAMRVRNVLADSETLKHSAEAGRSGSGPGQPDQSTPADIQANLDPRKSRRPRR